MPQFKRNLTFLQIRSPLLVTATSVFATLNLMTGFVVLHLHSAVTYTGSAWVQET